MPKSVLLVQAWQCTRSKYAELEWKILFGCLGNDCILNNSIKIWLILKCLDLGYTKIYGFLNQFAPFLNFIRGYLHGYLMIISQDLKLHEFYDGRIVRTIHACTLSQPLYAGGVSRILLVCTLSQSLYDGSLDITTHACSLLYSSWGTCGQFSRSTHPSSSVTVR